MLIRLEISNYLFIRVAGRDCGFRNGSKVAVLFARYTGFGDPIYTAVSEAQKKNMSIYLGLPKPPFISICVFLTSYQL